MSSLLDWHNVTNYLANDKFKQKFKKIKSGGFAQTHF